MSDDEERPLRDPIDRLLRHLRAPSVDVLSALRSSWSSVVGDDLAPLVRLVTVREGVLVVTSSDPAVTSELRWREAAVVAAARRLGAEVSALSIRHGGSGRLSDPSW